MISILNILFYHPVSEATPNSKITGAYCGFRIRIGSSDLIESGSSLDPKHRKTALMNVVSGDAVLHDVPGQAGGPGIRPSSLP